MHPRSNIGSWKSSSRTNGCSGRPSAICDPASLLPQVTLDNSNSVRWRVKWIKCFSPLNQGYHLRQKKHRDLLPTPRTPLPSRSSFPSTNAECSNRLREVFLVPLLVSFWMSHFQVLNKALLGYKFHENKDLSQWLDDRLKEYRTIDTKSVYQKLHQTRLDVFISFYHTMYANIPGSYKRERTQKDLSQFTDPWRYTSSKPSKHSKGKFARLSSG
jgi:hypothetical protein